MAQLIEYTTHTDRHFLHHFVFEANDGIQFNGFHGNFSLNKYMSLNDWQTIYECLRNDIAAYTNQSDLQPEPKQCILNAINIRLDISWIEFDRGLYHRLLPNLDMDQVYPFVMHVLVGAHSNVAEFSGSVRPMTNAMPEVSKVNESDDKIASDAESILPELKNCRVMLPKLKTLNGIPLTQKISMSSTPLIRHASNSVIPIGNDLSVISSELDAHDTQLNCNGTQNGTQNGTHNTRKRLFDQITVTPANKVLESKRKRRKIRLSPSQHLKSARKVRRKLIDKSVKKVQKVPKSRTTKAKPKVKDKPKEKLELNHVQEQAPTPVRMISDLDRQSQEPKRILTETPNEWNLEKMSMEDILNTFDNSRDRLTKLFNEYLKQTDEIVQKAGDYSPMDVMSMISHDQFGAMADVLYENYTPVGDINCGALFLELLLPEWVLAIFMDKLALTRTAAIEYINEHSQSKHISSHQSTIIRLDDTSNLENMST